MQKYKFLMIEDQPVDTEMAVRALKKNDINFDYIRVETEKDFRNAIKEYNPDLIISDYSMPLFNGMDALKIANEVCPEIPFIILTGSINEETAVECMKAGATDYLLKDNMTRLPFAVLDAIKKFKSEKQKQVIEIKLTESEKRYTALFQNNHAVMLLVDPENGKIIDANPAACNFYGYSHKELKRMSMTDLNKLPDNELKEKYQKALRGEINLFLVKHYLANGVERFVDVYIGPIKINERELLYSIIHDVTDRVEAENAIIQSEAKYKFMFDNNPQPMWIYDLETLEFLEVNKTAINHYGYSIEEFLSMTLKDIRPKEDVTLLLTDIENTKHSYNPISEWKHIKKNGEIINVEISSHEVLFNNKMARHVLINDITAKKKAEEENKILAHAIKSINDCVSVTDLNNNLLFVNESFLNTYGFNKEEIIGRNIDIISSPKNSVGIHQQILEDTLNKGWQGELWNKRKDGSEFPIHISTSNITDENGKLIALVGVANDITKRKYDENVQHILHEIARTFMSNKTLDELLALVHNELDEMLDTTNFFVALYNPETDMLRKVVFVDEKDEFVEWKSKDSLSGQVVKQGKTILFNKDEIKIFAQENNLNFIGTPAACWLGVPLIIDEKVIGVIVVQSYTNTKAFDNSSAKLMELIAHEIAIYFDRKNMLQNLILAKEKAEESDRLKTSFLANISHEIRTPMNGLLGFSEMLAKPELTEGKREVFIDVIRKSGAQLLSIIDDIIDISRIETNQVHINNNLFDLNETMAFIYDLFKPRVEELNLEFKYLSPDCEESCIIETDKVRFQQVLSNLINNAIKFTHKGFIHFGYKIINESIRFFVKDSGIGIDDEYQKLIFERFRQVDEGSSRNYGGTGLGLSISKALIEKLGGTIWVESKPDEGSTFYFSIPYTPKKNIKIKEKRISYTDEFLKKDSTIL
ncbi:MAG: PAS domain S-box protein, partial [Bacteroidales bacterium]